MRRLLKLKSVYSMVIVLMLLSIASCATVKDSWSKLTPDEKARIIVNDLQSQINNLWNQSQEYIRLNPQHSQYFKTNIAPVFSTANKTIKTVAELSSINQITPDQVYAKVQPMINEIVRLLLQIGMNV